MLWNLPLEQIEMRYTSMQHRVTTKAFEDAGIEYTNIDGEVIDNKLNSDNFLNPFSTNHFKLKQLSNVCKLFSENKVKDGDVFYVSDLWFPGLECIKYMAYFAKLDVKIYGIFHAGSFTDTDTVNGMKHWAKHFEECIIKSVDGIFLGSEQIRKDLIEKFSLGYEDLKKLHVTGLAFDSTELEKYKTDEKEDIIVFPHRLHPEKQIDVFNALRQYFPDSKFVVTHELNLSKDEYFKLLAKSKILFSASLQENFGYSILEACSLGCTPIMPINDTCYKYMYPNAVLYDSFEEAIELIKHYQTNKIDLTNIPKYYDDSLDRQVDIIKRECKL